MAGDIFALHSTFLINYIFCLGFFGSDGALKERFLSAADQKRDKYSFAHTLDSDIMEKEGHKE